MTDAPFSKSAGSTRLNSSGSDAGKHFVRLRECSFDICAYDFLMQRSLSYRLDPEKRAQSGDQVVAFSNHELLTRPDEN